VQYKCTQDINKLSICDVRDQFSEWLPQASLADIDGADNDTVGKLYEGGPVLASTAA
jgi:hypothetical protein